MVQFAQIFLLPEIVATLSRQLGWSHLVKLAERTEHTLNLLKGCRSALIEPAVWKGADLNTATDFEEMSYAT